MRIDLRVSKSGSCAVEPINQNGAAGRLAFYRQPLKTVAGVLLLFVLLMGSKQSFGQVGTWTPVANLAPDQNGGVMILMSDGTVLCKSRSGGGQGKIWDKLTPNASGSYINGTWSQTAPMINDRLYFSSQVLRDGRLYVAGGEYGAGGSAGEVYNPVTNAWTATPAPGMFISDGNSEILPDGKVLQGQAGFNNKIWDPATNTYAAAPNCLRWDNEAAWVKLPDNSILFLDNYGPTSERYIPSTGTWINDAVCPVALFDPFGFETGAGFLLPDGRAFFLGSTGATAYYTPSGTTAPGTWAAGPTIPSAQGQPDAPGAMMVNGKILCPVSPVPTSGNHFPTPTAYYEFDYLTNTFTQINAPMGGLTFGAQVFISNLLDLPDGSVLYSYQTGTRYYIYTPAGSPLAAGKPTVSTISRTNCDTFVATGTLFNGISEGACYGDDWQNASNYPLIRLTSGTNVYYTKTFNWNSTGVKRGAAADTVTFSIPGSVPAGTYSLEVVANGIASTPVTFVYNLNVSPATTSLCTGSTQTFTDTWPGGTWTSSNTAVASIGSASGVASALSAGSTVISYTYSPGCVATATLNVTTGPSAITGTFALCTGGTSTLGSTPGGGVWTSSNPAIASVGSGTGLVTGAGVGVADITYTLTGGCFVSQQVTVSAGASSITGTTSVCVGLTTTLNSTPAGGTWTSSNSAIAQVGSSTGIVLGVASGAAGITYTMAGGCFVATTVNVNSSPSGISGLLGLCTGSASTLSSSPSGGTWISNVPAVATVGSASGVVTGVSTGTTDITYTFGGTCYSTATVTVNTLTAINGVATICVGATTTLTNPTSGGTWSSNAPGIASVGPTTGLVSGLSGGVATITYSMGAGCFVTFPVTVNGLTGPITGSLSLCTGNTSLLSASPAGGVWSSGNPTVATVGAGTGLVTGVATGTSDITYTMTGGCFAYVTVTVSFGASGITGLPAVCTGSTSTLSSTPTGGIWTSSNPTIASVGATSGVVAGVSPGFTTVSYSIGSGCNATVIVTVHPVPAMITVTGGGSMCAGTTGIVVGLTGSAVGIDYQLYRGATAIGLPLPGTGFAMSFGPQTVTGSYSVIGTDALTRCATTMLGTANITVYPAPNLFNVTGGGGYCAGGTGVAVGLSGSDPGFYYQLYRSGVLVSGTTISGTGGALSFGLQTIGGVYTVVATNSSTACTAVMNGSAVVNVNTAPTVYAVTGGGGYCFGGGGEPVGLSNSDIGVNYQLYLGTTPIGAPFAGTGITFNFGLFTGAGTYTVKATNATTGCKSNMSGSAVITIEPLPAVFNVTGGGSYCTGGAGAPVGLSGSAIGVSYQLYLGATIIGSAVAGTGFPISFGLQSGVGTYTVIATNTSTGCNSNMTGSAVVSTIGLPNIYTVTGGGNYCAGGTGVHIGLSNSDIGTSYQLFNGATAIGSAMAGTGAALDFGAQTLAGTYTVVGTISACSSNMTGSAVITIDPLPTPYTVTGGGSYCLGGTGVHVGLSNSTTGVDYQLYMGATVVGSPVAGTGAALDFGLQTAAGTYTVVAMNNTTGCTNNMTGSVVITINPLPTAYNVLGGGPICFGGAGLPIYLSGSQTGVVYQLYNSTIAVGSPVSGTGSAITFGTFATAGIYTVVATNTATGCMNTMTGSATIVINALPIAYTVTGGGGYCAGGTGAAIGLASSQTGVNYQVYLGTAAVGTSVAGTGSALVLGSFTTAGSYTVKATDATTGCVNTMTGSVTVSINPLPASIPMSGGGAYCLGGSGVHVGLVASVAGINYQLYLGGVAVGSPVAGIGSALDFGLQTAAGVYTATGTNATTGCTSNMTGSVTVSINALPLQFTMTGGGSFCAGGTGVAVGLAASQPSIRYQLYRGTTAVGAVLVGTGALVNFGLQTVAGVYTVVGTNTTTGCTNTMTGSVTVVVNPLPTAYTLTGGGGYCTGGTGVAIGVSNSDAGVNYQLYRASLPVGTAVAGTGSAISFGLQTVAGTYTVKATNATTGCINTMTGSVTVVVNPLPTVYSVTGGGGYCAGPGLHVGLSGSIGGVSYQLFRGTTPVGSALSGTGAALDFGVFTTAGTYTVVATSTATGCVNNMYGSAVITALAPPTAYNVTGGGGYCTGGTGLHIGLAGSNTGVVYQLYRGTTSVGSPVAGTGAGLDFGLQTIAGTYTVTAAYAGTPCTSTMTGSAVITVNPLPTAFTATGGGTMCAGSAGLHVYLSGSATGVNYQLYRGTTAVGTALAGTGAALDFGLQTTAGAYTVKATNAATGCVNTMAGTATITVNAAPTAYFVTGGGTYCSGGSGVAVGLSGSQVGVLYQLYNGTSPVGSPLSGSGGALSFGLKTAAGTYTVLATSTSTTCQTTMTGSATVTISALPRIDSINGGGTTCSGGSGLHIGLNNSVVGVSYRLYRGTTLVGTAVAGTGAAIDFGAFLVAGTYTAKGTNTSTGCVNTMYGTATIVVNVAPALINVTGGGTMCAGSPGVHVGLVASATGVNYQLYLGTTPVGSPIAGIGTAIDFGAQTVGGTYTVLGTFASTSCSANMLGSAIITVYPVPTVFTVTGGGSFCAGGAGVHIGLSSSSVGVIYKLYRGTTLVGSTITGTGSAIDFGLFTTAGTYTAVGYMSSTSCASNMSGSATIVVNPTPTVTGSIYTVAPASSITLTGSIAGGTWTSSLTSIATVGSASGVVTGVALGSTMISYTLPTGCFGVHTVAVTATGHRSVAAATVNGGAVTLAPNPNQGIFTIKGSLEELDEQPVWLELSNLLGQVVYSEQIVVRNGILDHEIRLNNAANGMYLLSIRTNEEKQVLHVVVKQ